MRNVPSTSRGVHRIGEYIKGDHKVQIKVHRESLADMERGFLHLLVILLALFHLTISSNAIPSTRAQRLMLQETRDLQALYDTLHESSVGEGTMKDVIRGRIDLESNDYSGSGANDHHTPKPPGRKMI